MVITKEIEDRFRKCLNDTVIFCTKAEQLKILGEIYFNIIKNPAFLNFSGKDSDYECYFKHATYGWQDGYNYTYFSSKHNYTKFITFDEIMGVKTNYELW